MNSVVTSPEVACPDVFVLDVGIIDGRGWSVIECNECWASGIYACKPNAVLDTLLSDCIACDTMTPSQRRWDFQQHYFHACADGRKRT